MGLTDPLQNEADGARLILQMVQEDARDIVQALIIMQGRAGSNGIFQNEFQTITNIAHIDINIIIDIIGGSGSSRFHFFLCWMMMMFLVSKDDRTTNIATNQVDRHFQDSSLPFTVEEGEVL
jgi:hypothetical protein